MMLIVLDADEAASNPRLTIGSPSPISIANSINIFSSGISTNTKLSKQQSIFMEKDTNTKENSKLKNEEVSPAVILNPSCLNSGDTNGDSAASIVGAALQDGLLPCINTLDDVKYVVEWMVKGNVVDSKGLVNTSMTPRMI